MNRFKNYEAGRLTGNPDARPKTSQTSGSDTEGENSLEDIRSQEKIDGKDNESQENMNLEQGMLQQSQHLKLALTHSRVADIYQQISALVDPSAGCNTTRGCQAPKAPAFTGVFTTDKDGTLTYTVKTSTDMDEARRDELELIKTLFLIPGAPKELNIPSPMRKKVLEAISTSTDAGNLRPVADHCYLLLKSCSHRNFIRLGVSNGTFETVCMATGLGIVLTIAGILAMLCLAFLTPSFRHCSRWRGIGIWPMWSIGVGLILSGLRGSCFFLLLFSRRQPLPWEKFDDSASILTQRSKPMRFLSKLMIFDRKLRVKDDNLRGLQRKIVMQSILGGAVFATLMEVFFLALPIWAPIH
jgi:hypothetical protein